MPPLDQPITLSDLYNSIKAQEANFPLPQTEITITAGTLDLGYSHNPTLPRKEISVSFADQYEDGSTHIVYRPVPPGEDFGRGVTAMAVAVPNHGGVVNIANVLKLNVQFLITNWTFIPNGSVQFQLGSQTQIVQHGTTEVVFTNVTETSAPLSIVVNGYLFANGQPEPYPMVGLLPLKINWSLVGAGAITIPVLPVSLIFAPIVDAQKKNQSSISTASSSGTTTSFSFATQNSTTTPVPSSFQNVSDIQKGMSGLGTVLSKVPIPVVAAIGTALNVIASGLGSSTATQNTSTTVTQQGSITINNSSTAVQSALASNGGPGIGDLVSYYYNARVVWYSENGVMRLALLGFDGFVQPTVNQLKTALSNLAAQPEGSIDSTWHLNAGSIKSLLALDPFVKDGPNAVLDSSRFIDVSQGIVEIGGGVLQRAFSYTLSATNTNTSSKTVTNVENDSPGFLSFLGLGVTTAGTFQTQISQSNSFQTTSSQTFSQSFTFNGNGQESYSCWVYYDVWFGSFAFRDMTDTNQQIRISGTYYDVNRHSVPNATVVIKTAGTIYTTDTNDAGQFSFKLPSLNIGRLIVSADSAEAQLVFNGSPLTDIELNSH